MKEEKETKKTKTTTKKSPSKKSTTTKSVKAEPKKTATKKTTTKKTTKTKSTTEKKTPAKKTVTKKVAVKKETGVAEKKVAPAKTTRDASSKTVSTIASPAKKRGRPKVQKVEEVPTPIQKEVEPNLEEAMKEVYMEPDETFQSVRNDSKKEIPVSNYLIVAIIVIWVFIIAFIGFKLYGRYEEKLYQDGYYIHEGYFKENASKNVSIQKLNLADVNQVITSSSGNLFIFFNFRGYEETYQLEKDLVNVLLEHHIQNNFYYVDLTDVPTSESCGLPCAINSELHRSEFTNAPAIAYYKNGQLMDIAQREDKKVLEAADFVKVLDMYEIK